MLKLSYVCPASTATLRGSGARALLRSLHAPCFRNGRGAWDTPAHWLPRIADRVDELGGTLEPLGARRDPDEETEPDVRVTKFSDRTLHLSGMRVGGVLLKADVRRMRVRRGLWAVPATERERVLEVLQLEGLTVAESETDR